jgi:dephospho-CoA kinase
MGPPLGWVLPFRKEKGVELDALGEEVFRECDGERRLEQIIERFAERHRVRFHEARQSVVQFLSLLFERKLITLSVPEDAVVRRSRPGKRRRA